MSEKKCVICKKIKLFSAFGRRRSTKDGKRTDCRECRKKEYLKPKEQVEAWNKKRRERMSLMGLSSKGRRFSEETRKKMSDSRKKLFSEHDYKPANIKRIFHRYKKGGFLISEKEFEKFIFSNCEYCGCEPITKLHSHNKKDYIFYNGIDRVDNDIGYELENCVTCCVFCNKAKLSRSKEDFLNWIKKVYKKNFG